MLKEAEVLLTSAIKSAQEARVEEVLKGDVKFDLRNGLRRELRDIRDDKYTRSGELEIGTTSDFIANLFDTAVRIVTMPVSKAYSAMVSKVKAKADGKFKNDVNYHAMGVAGLYEALESSEHPIMAFAAVDNNGVEIPGRLVLVTDTVDKDNKAVAIIENIKTKGHIDNRDTTVDKIITTYGKNDLNRMITKAFTEDRVLFEDKKRSREFLKRQGVQFSKSLKTSDFTDSILKFKNNYNSKYEKSMGKLSLSSPVEETKDLIAVHNVSADNLRNILSMKGMPMPSIAIIKAAEGHNDYGDYSIIFSKNTINPEKSEANKVYGGDAWTPIFPKIESKLNDKALGNLRDKLTSVKGARFGDGNTDYDEESFKTHYEKAKSLTEYVTRNYDLKLAYLQDIGKPYTTFPATTLGYDSKGGLTNEEVVKLAETIPENIMSEYEGKGSFLKKKALLNDNEDVIAKVLENNGLAGKSNAFSVLSAIDNYHKRPASTEHYTVVDYDKAREDVDALINKEEYLAWASKLLDGIFEKEGIYNGKEYLTSTGNRRTWEQLHWDVSLDNIVKAMKLQENGHTYLGESLMAVAQKELASIDEIKSNSGRLQKLSDEEFARLKDELSKRESDIITSFENRSSSGANDLMVRDSIRTNIADSIRGSKSEGDVLRKLKKWYRTKSATIKDAKAIWNLAHDIAKLPTGYFEAKPERIVDNDEIAAVIVPSNAPEDITKALEEANIKTSSYEAENDTDRISVLNEVAERNSLKFSISSNLDNDLQAILDDSFNSDRTELYVGEGSEFLHNLLGVNVLSQAMSPRKAYAVMATKEEAKKSGRYDEMTNYHGIGKELYRESIEASEDPVAVIVSDINPDTLKRRDDSIALVTNIKDGENNYVVVYETLEAPGRLNNKRVKINRVTTVFGKEELELYFKKAIDESRVLFLDKKRSQDVLGGTGNQLSGGRDLDFENNIQLFLENFNYLKGKTKTSTENASDSESEFGKKLQKALREVVANEDDVIKFSMDNDIYDPLLDGDISDEAKSRRVKVRSEVLAFVL